MMCRLCPVPGADALARRTKDGVRGVVVHRIEVSQEDASYADTADEVARFFREHPLGKGATGGAMPYPLLVAADGSLTQSVPLCRVTPHARTHNPSSVGVGVVGDFRTRAPTAAQRASLVLLCAALLVDLGLDVSALHGHDELSAGSADPDKECPGRLLPMPALRADVAAAMRAAPPRLELVW